MDSENTSGSRKCFVVAGRSCSLYLAACLASLLGPVPSFPSDLTEGTRALHQGRFDQAAGLAERVLKVDQRSTAARLLLAQANLAQGKYLPAYRQLREALRAEPKNVDALYYLGQLCNALSQVEYQALYALAPDSARVHQLQAELYQVQEKTAKAEEEYQAALKANPRLVEVLVSLGDLNRSQFRFDEALSYYSRALEIDPLNYDAVYGVGACHHFQQGPQKALEYFRRAVTIDPKSAAARLALGDVLLRINQAPAAVNELKAAIALEPKMRQAYTLLGKAQQKLGQTKEAEASFKMAQNLIQSEMESREGLLNAEDLDKSSPSR
jgi:tetratricopeptide (TPR) repeat protein